MSAAVAAIAKKLAVMLATDKRTWKLIGAIAGGLLFIALLPVMVLLSIGHQLEETDTETNFGAAFIQNLTPEQQAQFSQMESDGKAISDELTSLNLKSEIVKAQVIYFTYFEDVQKEKSFFQDYCSCFQKANGNDEMLIYMLNSKFSLNISDEEFMRSYAVIQNVSIDENLFVNLSVKNNIDLAKWAENAYESGWGCVLYTDGNILTEEKYKALQEQYPDAITPDCEKWMSRRTCDNAGLLKSYLWYDSESRTISPKNYAVSDMNMQELYAFAKKKGSMDNLPDTVGLAVINGETIGVCVGNGDVVYAKSVSDGVVKEQISDGSWTGWFEIPWIQYGSESSFSNDIQFSEYDSAKKNNLDLVKWAENAATSGWGYVYGTYGGILDEKTLTAKLSQYPSEVGAYESFIRRNWFGRRTADCVGLIKGYGWYNSQSGEITIGANSMPDIGADGMFENAKIKGTIDTIPEVPGLAVWEEGHIGIYIGNGEVIEAMNTERGVVKTKLAGRRWTHWLQIPYISYVKKK